MSEGVSEGSTATRRQRRQKDASPAGDAPLPSGTSTPGENSHGSGDTSKKTAAHAIKPVNVRATPMASERRHTNKPEMAKLAVKVGQIVYKAALKKKTAQELRPYVMGPPSYEYKDEDVTVDADYLRHPRHDGKLFADLPYAA